MGWLLLLLAANERAGRFRTSVCDSCTYLRGFSVLELAALPVCRAVLDVLSAFAVSDLVILHMSVAFLGHEKVCRAVSDVCVRFLQLSAGLSVAAL